MKHILLCVALLTASCQSIVHRDRGPEAYQVVPLKYASVGDVVEIVNDLEGTCPSHCGLPRGPGFFAVADARTNSVILRGPEDGLDRVLQLIGQLDVKAK